MSKLIGVNIRESNDSLFLVSVPDWFNPKDEKHRDLLLDNDLQNCEPSKTKNEECYITDAQEVDPNGFGLNEDDAFDFEDLEEP